MSKHTLKLTYFDFGGRAEAVRLAFYIGGVEFNDHRIQVSEWPQLKPTTPLGSIPVLEFDGKAIAQSNTILRLAGKLGGLYPSDPYLSAKADEISDSVEDFNSHNPDNFFGIMFSNASQEEKAKKFQDISTGDGWAHKWFTITDKLLTNSGFDTFSAGDSVTTGDLKLYTLINTVKFFFGGDEFVARYPRILKLFNAVDSHPKVKEWNSKQKK
eukprot:TRINITY_DN640_c0_g1_i1.p1 TRINITY_DN640_c0_g1~~TRINITY_DN640_c0_g1_i1.p1  ORF type:complete len:213 (+),score=41.36 TRINITY_DN640_c0_g1_i1:737-1375(+)